MELDLECVMKELKDERSKTKLKRYACDCFFTSHLLVFILWGRFRCRVDGTLY